MGKVESLLGTMKLVNPQLNWQVFTDDAKPHPTHHVVHPEVSEDTTQRLLRIEEKVDTLLTRLDLIFGDQVLVNGKFTNIINMHDGKMI